MRSGWSFWVDVGGTFTDCIARDPTGQLHRTKLLSADDAPVRAMREFLGLSPDEEIGPVSLRLGTTRATNALLERAGARVGLVITRGFADLPLIGNQARPELFAIDIQKPAPLHAGTAEVDERLDADGHVLQPLDRADVERALAGLKKKGVRSLAVCLLHAYANDAHERLVADVAEAMGFEHVSTGAALTPTIGALDRCDTTILNAYLSPIVRAYLNQLKQAMPAARVKVMTSAGGVVAPESLEAKDALLSGPAGGVVGAWQAAKAAGFEQAIALDMGGTSTDVSRCTARPEMTYATVVDGVRVVAPMRAIETVAAGGGSICGYDGTRLTVGPASAGATPGPACYGRGGPLTITDVNLFNGKIDSARFPFPLDADASRRRLEELADRVGGGLSLRELADGLTRIANAKMAAAIAQVSAARGYDPANHALVAFGGAAPQHACAIADSLGIGQILLHPLAGVLSAYGVGVADVQRFAERSVLRELTPNTPRELEPSFAEMERDLRGQVLAEGIDAAAIDPPTRLLDLRYRGEQTPITVPRPVDGDWATAFAQRHRELYGHAHDDRAIEVTAVRVELVGRTPTPEMPRADAVACDAEPTGRTTAHFDGNAHDTPTFSRRDLRPGHRLRGPAIVYDDLSTIVLDPGWSAVVSERFDLLAARGSAGSPTRADAGTAADPVRLELFNNGFAHIATQMGLTLQRTAVSVNVKERLDFSCALLDAEGRLVVNAPHIPVHLGAMGATVRGLLEHVSDLRPGDAYLSNHPDLGGSHLPDLTVMTPVFDEAGETLRFFAASRAHHAEIGGRRPGSTFPFARSLAEEGVVFRNFRLMRGGVLDEPGLRRALAEAAYPSRSPDENVADLRAALAANTLGARELGALVDRHGWATVSAYMGHIRAAAEAVARRAIAALTDGVYTFEDALDDGTPLRLRVTVDGDALRLDFAGTGGPCDNAFNANRAVVESAVLYCVRCLIDADVPLNGGLMAPVTINLPTCMLNPPPEPDPAQHVAVAAGNVELSQRVVDLVFGALGIAAGSQGTMNNVVFGDAAFGYYETLGGGSGAGPTFAGADAVHTHMTNTRLTDVEVLERQLPVRVEQFAIRRGSGGSGTFAGGDGMVRSLRFLRPVEVSLMTQRRTTRPAGLHGGEAGAAGLNELLPAGGGPETLGSLAQFQAKTGDVLTLQTPGGGGCGLRRERP